MPLVVFKTVFKLVVALSVMLIDGPIKLEESVSPGPLQYLGVGAGQLRLLLLQLRGQALQDLLAIDELLSACPLVVGWSRVWVPLADEDRLLGEEEELILF
jgi:hypothetical protein